MAATLKQLALIRERIAEAEAEILEIDNAGLTAEDVQDRVKALVHTLQTRFDQDFIGLALSDPNGTVTASDIINACTSEDHPGDKLLVLEAWLRPELLEQKLLAAAQPYIKSGKTALPLDQRPALLRQHDKRLHEMLIEEEAMVCELLAAGHAVYRRADIDPLVILGAPA